MWAPWVSARWSWIAEEIWPSREGMFEDMEESRRNLPGMHEYMAIMYVDLPGICPGSVRMWQICRGARQILSTRTNPRVDITKHMRSVFPTANKKCLGQDCSNSETLRWKQEQNFCSRVVYQWLFQTYMCATNKSRKIEFSSMLQAPTIY